MASRVPATEPPPFDVADGVRCVPVGELTRLDDAGRGLRDRRRRQDRVGRDLLAARSRDGSRRRHVDPARATRGSSTARSSSRARARTFEAVVLQLEAMVDVRLDRRGVRTPRGGRGHAAHRPDGRADDDEGRRPRASASSSSSVASRTSSGSDTSSASKPTRSSSSTDRFRRLPIICTCIARLRDSATTRPSDLHRRHDHAAARDTRGSAVVGRVAGSRRELGTDDGGEEPALPTDDDGPTRRSTTCTLYSAGIRTEMGWQEAPDLQRWLDSSRLNLMHGLGEKGDRSAVGELQGRFFTALFPAFEKLEVFAAEASPRERQRMFRTS